MWNRPNYQELDRLDVNWRGVFVPDELLPLGPSRK
jgi:hypothetical protein